MTPQDKTDILIGLREAARILEQSKDPDHSLTIMGAIGTELLVLALKYGPRLDEIAADDKLSATDKQELADRLEALVRNEINAVGETVTRLHQNRIEETDVINERLMRRYDPSLAFNEAINRAIEKKKAAHEEVHEMTGQQKAAFFGFQVPSLMHALLNAGRINPKPLVRRLGNAEVSNLLNMAGKPNLLPKDIQ